jgi:hypothetical protein
VPSPTVQPSAEAGRHELKVESTLRIFLSLDIDGSTKYKHPRTAKELADQDSWVRPFLAFYRMSVEEVGARWADVIAELREADLGGTSGKYVFGDPPEFWKGAGDEVLFSKIVRSPLDVLAAIYTLVAVMKAHRGHFSSKTHTAALNVKGAAWLAGFPLNNTEIAIGADGASPAGDSGDPLIDNYRLLSKIANDAQLKRQYKIDYIGPSIDLGFRLREFASVRQLVVSIDILWLLWRARQRMEPDELKRCPIMERLRIGYSDRRTLRGILGEDPYPLFWIHTDDSSALDELEDALMQRVHRIDSDGLERYCNEYLDESGPLRMRPYIEGCFDAKVSEISNERRAKLERFQNHLNGSAEQLASLMKSDDEANAADAISQEARAFATEVTTELQSPRGTTRDSQP